MSSFVVFGPVVHCLPLLLPIPLRPFCSGISHLEKGTVSLCWLLHKSNLRGGEWIKLKWFQSVPITAQGKKNKKRWLEIKLELHRTDLNSEEKAIRFVLFILQVACSVTVLLLQMLLLFSLAPPAPQQRPITNRRSKASKKLCSSNLRSAIYHLMRFRRNL